MMNDRGNMRFRDVIEYLHLSACVTNALLRADITTIAALCAYDRAELKKLEGIGPCAIEQIRVTLAVRCGRGLAGDRTYTPEHAAQTHRDSHARLAEKCSSC